MKRYFFALLTLGFALMQSGCADLLFHADFDSDAVGARPSSSPPGRPTGDMIMIWPADPGNLVVVADRINTNSLAHSYQEAVSQADFIGIETRRVVPEFWAEWRGCAERFSSDTPRFFFSVGNHSTGIANLEIVNGEFRASGERLTNVEFDEVHLVGIHIDNTAGTYTVDIYQTASTTGDDRAACSTVRRADCPADFRFEEGECRSGPNLLGHRSRCPLEGRNSCATCRADERLDSSNGTCIRRLTETVNSNVKPLSGRGLVPGDARQKIQMSYDNVVASDPASYSIDDIKIFASEP